MRMRMRQRQSCWYEERKGGKSICVSRRFHMQIDARDDSIVCLSQCAGETFRPSHLDYRDVAALSWACWTLCHLLVMQPRRVEMGF